MTIWNCGVLELWRAESASKKMKCACAVPCYCDSCGKNMCAFCDRGRCDVDGCRSIICRSCSDEYKACTLCAGPIHVYMCNACFHDSCALHLVCDDCKLLGGRYERGECDYADMSEVQEHFNVERRSTVMKIAFRAMKMYAAERGYRPGGKGYKRLRDMHSGEDMLRRSARIDDRKDM